MRLSDETKPKTVTIAQNSHIARLKVPTVRTIAPRPASLRIARVLPPLAAARRAIFDMSRDPSASFNSSSAARVPACLHASHVADEPHKFLRLFDPDRLARAAHGRRGLDDAYAVDRTLKRRPIDDLAQRAVDPRRHRSAEPA